MSHRHLARAALLLALAAAGCGSPLDSHPDDVLTTDVASEIDEAPTPTATATRSPGRVPGHPPTTQPTPERDRRQQTESAPSPESTSKPEAKAEPKPEAKAQPKPEPESKPEANADTKAESKPAPKPEARAKPKPDPEEPPAAKGSPLNIAIFEIVGAPYSGNQQYVEDTIAEACGGTGCINVRLEYIGPKSLTCTVAAIDQPNPIFAGDTITFTLSDVCDEDSEE